MAMQDPWEDPSPSAQMDPWEESSPTEASPKKSSSPGFFDQHPNLQTAMRYGLPLAAGVATMPFTAGMSFPAIMGVEGLAQLGAEGLLQGVGVNPKSLTDLSIAGASGPVGRFVGGTVANLPKWIPGFSDAVKASLVPEARELPGKLLPGDSKAAYSALSQAQKSQPQRIMQFPTLQSTVDELNQKADNVPWDQLQSKLRMTGQSDLFDQITATLKGSPGKVSMVSPTVGGKASLPTGLPKQAVMSSPPRAPGLTFDEARASVEALGRVIRNTTDPVERGVYQKLYGSMLNDIEHAPMPANGPLKEWRVARDAAKAEHARLQLSQATERAISTRDGIDRIDANKVVEWLRKTDDIKSRVSPSQYRAIVNEYRNMAAMSGHNMSKFFALLGGFVVGGSKGALATFGGSELLSKAMMTETGRKVVRQFVGDPSRSTLRRLAMVTGVEMGAALPNEGENE